MIRLECVKNDFMMPGMLLISLVAQWSRTHLSMEEMQVCFLGWEAGEGNGNLLLYSCLGNPMDRGA